MFGYIRGKLFGNAASKQRAKSRLHFVLVQDRTGLTGEDMANFKAELMNVIDKYFVIDKSGFDVAYKREADSTTLLINSPVVVRRQDSTNSGIAGARQSAKKRGKKQSNAAATA